MSGPKHFPPWFAEFGLEGRTPERGEGVEQRTRAVVRGGSGFLLFLLFAALVVSSPCALLGASSVSRRCSTKGYNDDRGRKVLSECHVGKGWDRTPIERGISFPHFAMVDFV
jgi:hypothetical protein